MKKIAAAAAAAGLSVAAYMALTGDGAGGGDGAEGGYSEEVPEDEFFTEDGKCKKDELGEYPDDICDENGNYLGDGVVGKTYPVDKPFMAVLSDFFSEFIKNPKKALMKLWNYLKADKKRMFISISVMVLILYWFIFI